jgi:hypothetical protein
MIKPTEQAVIAAAVAKVLGPLEAQLVRLEKAVAVEQARRRNVRKQQIDDVARQVIALHDRVVEQEIERGMRKRTIRKAGMTLAERLQEIIDEGAVAKRTNGTWKGML